MPFYNRPDYRLKNEGVHVLNDAELLAIILSRGNKKENAVDLSNRLLKSHNFHKLSTLSLDELKKECKDEIKALKILSLAETKRRASGV